MHDHPTVGKTHIEEKEVPGESSNQRVSLALSITILLTGLANIFTQYLVASRDLTDNPFHNIGYLIGYMSVSILVIPGVLVLLSLPFRMMRTLPNILKVLLCGWILTLGSGISSL